MENNSIKKVVAIGIGAALFIIIGMLISIPTPLPNTSIQLQYAVQALFSLIFGPATGFFVGLIGHALKDAIQYGSPWWTWVIASALFGLIVGFFRKQIRVNEGIIEAKDILVFNVVQILANALVWGILAPIGDIIIYNEPTSKVFAQGALITVANSVTVAIGGTLLLVLYARTRTKEGSLSKD